MHRFVTRLAAPVAAVLISLSLAACGDDDPGGAASDAAHNDADVEFATGMIPHHAQALHMVEMAEGRGATPEFGQLLGDVEAAQEPEIEQMTGWLQEWGEDVPETRSPGGHGAHGGQGMGPGQQMMPGMMGPRDLDRLDRTAGERFERMWMRMMIEHHEGAIEMAETEQREGEFPDAIALAEDIVETQQAEIDLMEDLLRR
jgi:uncharacterized protein (DUF305 family)